MIPTIKAVVYINDGIVGAKSKSQCVEVRAVVLQDLDHVGLVLSLKKCALMP